MAGTKSGMRALVRRGAAAGKRRPAELRTGRLAEPSMCDRCGAVFVRRAWRRDRPVTAALLARARWVTCPACRQTDAQEYLGRLVLRGELVAADEDAIRRRIANVARRAAGTQPERRIVSLERGPDGLEVLTTSQKLAHRIAHELTKTFGGRAIYRWTDDGSLFAVWQRPAAR